MQSQSQIEDMMRKGDEAARQQHAAGFDKMKLSELQQKNPELAERLYQHSNSGPAANAELEKQRRDAFFAGTLGGLKTKPADSSGVVDPRQRIM